MKDDRDGDAWAGIHSRLNDVGLGCHKEAIGLPDALGYQVIQKDIFAVNCDKKRASADGLHKNDYFLTGSDDKLFPLISFCVLTTQRKDFFWLFKVLERASLQPIGHDRTRTVKQPF